jgi:hypothetical protein
LHLLSCPFTGIVSWTVDGTVSGLMAGAGDKRRISIA